MPRFDSANCPREPGTKKPGRFHIDRAYSQLHVEAELHHVPGPHHVFLAFGADLAGRPRSNHRASFYKIVEIDHLRGDEPSFEIGVDDTRSLWCGSALMN